MCNEAFANRIEIAVKKIGGVGAACQSTGITYPTLTRWKDGTSDPKLSNVVALAKAANVSLDWLVHGIGDPQDAQQPDIAAISAEKGISVEDAIDTIKTMIQSTQPQLAEDEEELLKAYRALDKDQKQFLFRLIVGGLGNTNTSGNKGIFNSPKTKVKNSFNE